MRSWDDDDGGDDDDDDDYHHKKSCTGERKGTMGRINKKGNIHSREVALTI